MSNVGEVFIERMSSGIKVNIVYNQNGQAISCHGGLVSKYHYKELDNVLKGRYNRGDEPDGFFRLPDPTIVELTDGRTETA